MCFPSWLGIKNSVLGWGSARFPVEALVCWVWCPGSGVVCHVLVDGIWMLWWWGRSELMCCLLALCTFRFLFLRVQYEPSVEPRGDFYWSCWVWISTTVLPFFLSHRQKVLNKKPLWYIGSKDRSILYLCMPEHFIHLSPVAFWVLIVGNVMCFFQMAGGPVDPREILKGIEALLGKDGELRSLEGVPKVFRWGADMNYWTVLPVH